jgi:hypothetical protein
MNTLVQNNNNIISRELTAVEMENLNGGGIDPVRNICNQSAAKARYFFANGDDNLGFYWTDVWIDMRCWDLKFFG